MSRNVTLLQLRTDIAAQCDFSVGTTNRYTSTLLNRIINQSIQRFRERISNEGITHFLVPATGTLGAGPTASYAFQSLDLSSLSPSLVRTYGVDIRVAGVVTSLAHRPFEERNNFTSSPTMTGQPRAWAHFQTRSIAIMPAPDTDYPYTVWYLPVLPDLVADGDTFDGVAGWEVWVMWDCVCQLIARDQYATAYSQAIAERDLAWTDIVRSSTKVSSAGGAHVGRDTMGQAGLWGRQPLRVVGASAGSAGVSANSILGTPSEVGQIETVIADATTSLGFSWQQKRFWIQPNIDLTGSVAADTAVQAALNSAYPGRVVYLPDGVIRKTTTWTIPSGVTLVGSPRAFNFGQRMYSSGESNFGTLINEYGTGVGFSMSGQQCACLDFTVYYPNQQTNSTPDVYDYAFDIPGNSHGNTVGNICVINPYRYMRIAADGFTGFNLTGRPLNMGIWLKRCADVVRLTNVHFKGVNYSEGAGMSAYIAANATAFLIDGPEGVTFTDCFAFGYFKGIQFYDADLDGFRGCDGTWTGGGLDTCGFCILVSESQCLMLAGFRVVNAAFAPTSYGVRFDDSRVPSGTPTYIERPSIELVNVTMHGTFDRPIWMTSQSHGICRMTGGNVWGNSNPFFREPLETQSWLQLNGVGMPTGVTRTEVGGLGAAVVDTNPISF